MRIYIIRHGETDWNRESLLQGRSDVPLNENGKRLARETAKGMADIPFDLAFTSPLARARETAQIVLEGRNIPILEEERIIELGFGEDEGKPWKKTEEFEGNSNIYHFFRKPDQYRPSRGAESLEELAQRTADFMRELCSREDLQNQTILVSTHGAAARGLLNSLRTWELADFWHRGVAPNCGVAVVECRDGQPVLLEENKVYYRLSRKEH